MYEKIRKTIIKNENCCLEVALLKSKLRNDRCEYHFIVSPYDDQTYKFADHIMKIFDNILFFDEKCIEDISDAKNEIDFAIDKINKLICFV